MSDWMSMNQIIHAAVRRDVARTEQALRALPAGDVLRARQVRTAWCNLVRELTHHHEAEDAIAWPFLASRGFDPALLEEMEAEHAGMKQALASTSAAIDAVVAAPTEAAVRAAADEVARARQVIDGHLAHEEADVEGIMGGLEDDREWKKAAGRMRPASIVDAANALAWMQDGAEERERSSLRAAIPGPVVTILTLLLARGGAGLALTARRVALGELLEGQQLLAGHHQVADGEERRQPPGRTGDHLEDEP